MSRAKGASKDRALADLCPSGDEVDIISHMCNLAVAEEMAYNAVAAQTDRERREAAAANAEADGDPMTPGQMKAVLVDLMRDEGMDDYDLYNAGLLERKPIDQLDTVAYVAEIRFMASASGRRGAPLAQQCAWFERMTAVDPTALRPDVRSAGYQRGNDEVHAEMRRRRP